jgi:NTE family protein
MNGPSEGATTMSVDVSRADKPHRKTHRMRDRPPFECIALLLQGGGALGAYQAGVYQSLAEASGSSSP